jgi:hypothetical protein
MVQDAVDDAGAIEAAHRRQAAGDSGGPDSPASNAGKLRVRPGVVKESRRWSSHHSR